MLGYDKDLLLRDQFELQPSNVARFVSLPLGRVLQHDAEVVLAL
jgi:hypothetical protein